MAGKWGRTTNDACPTLLLLLLLGRISLFLILPLLVAVVVVGQDSRSNPLACKHLPVPLPAAIAFPSTQTHVKKLMSKPLTGDWLQSSRLGWN
jgi:hypothetical protein